MAITNRRPPPPPFTPNLRRTDHAAVELSPDLRPGSAPHQVYGFLRHPHLRAGAPVAGSSEDTIRMKMQNASGSVPDHLQRHLLSGAHILHIMLGVLSALHYLAQNGWRCAELRPHHLLIDPAGRILLDLGPPLSAAGLRGLEASDVALVRQLCTELFAAIGDAAEAPDQSAETAQTEASHLLSLVDNGIPLREAVLRTRCVQLARLLPTSPADSRVEISTPSAALRGTQPLLGVHVSQGDRSESDVRTPRRSPARRRQRRRSSAKQRSRRERDPHATNRRQRRRAAERLVGLCTGIGRIRAAIGACDSALERAELWCETRARAVSEDLGLEPLWFRCTSPKAMATAFVAVAMLCAVLLP